MDAARVGPATRDGSELRPLEVVQAASGVVGGLGDWASRHCSFGLGANCPFVEAIAGGAMSKAERTSRFAAVAIGVVVTVLLVVMVGPQ